MNRIDGEARLKELFDEAQSIVTKVYGPDAQLSAGLIRDYVYFTVIEWGETPNSGNEKVKRRYCADFYKLDPADWSKDQSSKRNEALAETDELLGEKKTDDR